MAVLAAIDVGSNAMRLVIGSVDQTQHVTPIEELRESVRLGQDVFVNGVITEGTIQRATEAFRRFRETIDRHGARWTKAVGTSALRDAMNGELFLDRVQQASDIDIEVISGEEEARLIHLAIREKVNLKNRLVMLVDIGGGSTEITLVSDGSIISTESYKMGTVRLLQELGSDAPGENELTQLVQEYVDATQRRIRREIGTRAIAVCVGTGGNIDTLADLRQSLLGKQRDTVIEGTELAQILKKLKQLPFAERVAQLGLRPDRADVILPAAIIIQRIMQIAGVKEIVAPGVGLKDGLLIDMVQELYGDTRAVRRDQVIASALEIARKYQFDEAHGTTVARLAVQLFEHTRSMHNLGLDQRLLLEVAALLHDIGTFVSASDHHKHSQYLMMATPVIGLTQSQMAIVSNVARYHRKSMPKPQHDAYRALSSKDRVVVTKLAALLRLADALDNEHASKVAHVDVEFRKPRLVLSLFGEGDLLLEKWALMKKSQLFEEVFNVKIAIGK
jgi:exopolyphosphatase / guanosine-5'-triphosphate,3'-diphosphate pyrophosphatase